MRFLPRLHAFTPSPAFAPGRGAAALLLLLSYALASPASMAGPASSTGSAAAPPGDAIFTSTREVMALEAAPDGTLWAATTGGILRFDGRRWTKYTRRDGLLSHEWRRLWMHNGAPAAKAMNNAAMHFEDGQWRVSNQPLDEKPRVWRGQAVVATLEGVRWGNRNFDAPAEGGAIATAVLPLAEKFLLVALFGDGLWRFDGRNWTRAFPDLPARARHITALAGDTHTLWLGTRREGIFRRQNGKWTQWLQPDEPFFHNAQFLAQFGGALWMSTLEDGLMARSSAGWKRFGEPQLSSNAPRHLTVFQNALYLRHGGGRVDKWDGASWTKNVLAGLPRRGVYALAADEHRLYAAVWGGWSEWDGQKWTHHFDVAPLKGLPLMGLLPAGDRLWIATQSRGVGLWNRGGEFHWFDERHGLRDDWITALAQLDGHIHAGTFVAGLARFDGEKWRVWKELQDENVTALEPDGNGGLWVATRRGLWRLAENRQLTKTTVSWLDQEVQTLYAVPQGLWVGTRVSLNFLCVAAKTSRG